MRVLLEFAPMLAQLEISCPNDINDTAFSTKAIKNEVEKIEKKRLRELIIDIKSLIAEWESKSQLERGPMQREILKPIFKVIGTDGLKNIMRSNLTALMQGRVSTEVQSIIDELAEAFKNTCVDQLR